MAADEGVDGRGSAGEAAALAGLGTTRFPRANHLKGAWGESLLSATLQERLPAGWVLFDNWTTPGATANTDHLLIGPGGVFHIDAKAWSADVTISGGRLVVTRDSGSFESNKLGPLVGRSKLWREYIGCRWVETVACFVGTTLLDPASSTPTDRFEHRRAHCVTLDGLVDLILERRTCLTAEEVDQMAQRVDVLGRYAPPGSQPAPTDPAVAAPVRRSGGLAAWLRRLRRSEQRGPT